MTKNMPKQTLKNTFPGARNNKLKHKILVLMSSNGREGWTAGELSRELDERFDSVSHCLEYQLNRYHYVKKHVFRRGKRSGKPYLFVWMVTHKGVKLGRQLADRYKYGVLLGVRNEMDMRLRANVPDYIRKYKKQMEAWISVEEKSWPLNEDKRDVIAEKWRLHYFDVFPDEYVKIEAFVHDVITKLDEFKDWPRITLKENN